MKITVTLNIERKDKSAVPTTPTDRPAGIPPLATHKPLPVSVHYDTGGEYL